MSTSRRFLFHCAFLFLTQLSCAPRDSAKEPEKRVVVYSALDRNFSEVVFNTYEKRTGVRIDPKYDVESAKTVGLARAIMLEAERPRCDLFWNNEILNTLRLQKKGLLQPMTIANAKDFPEEFRSKDNLWFGFGARARILLVNTKVVPKESFPKGIADLIDPKWKGKIAIAKPLFGTTATHAVCLFATWGDEKAKAYYDALKANGVQVVSGNRQVAQAVGSGAVAFGITDTDDAMEEIADGSPVVIVYPDRGPKDLGTLFIPNTIAMVKGRLTRSRPGRLPSLCSVPRQRECWLEARARRFHSTPRSNWQARSKPPRRSTR